MLARRFTIVCLITMLFGIAFADLVARAGRDGIRGSAAGCAWSAEPGCERLSARF